MILDILAAWLVATVIATVFIAVLGASRKNVRQHNAQMRREGGKVRGFDQFHNGSLHHD